MPPVTHYSISPGDSVHVYREDKSTVRNTGSWVGPFSITSDTGKPVTVDYNGEPKIFNISQLLPNPSLVAEGELELNIVAFKKLCSPQPAGTLVFEILTPRDPRIRQTNTLAAVKRGISGLEQRELFKVVSREDIPTVCKKPSIMGGHFIPSIKQIGAPDELFKALLWFRATKIRKSKSFYTKVLLFVRAPYACLSH